MPHNPTSQTLHISSVAFNSLLLGEVMFPDWDMFHSKHVSAEYHVAARAVGGCGVYVSDRPGEHDFKILKRLVLPDGSVIRARFPGRPTRDCLFVDTAGDKKRVRSSNRCGILGDVADAGWNGDCAIYAHNTGSLTRISTTGSLTLSLEVLEYEVYTVSPITDYKHNVCFAPLGLIDMYNARGAVECSVYCDEDNKCLIKTRVRGCGRYGAYTSKKPTRCLVNMKQIEHSYKRAKCLLTLIIPTYVGSNKVTSQEIRVKF